MTAAEQFVYVDQNNIMECGIVFTTNGSCGDGYGSGRSTFTMDIQKWMLWRVVSVAGTVLLASARGLRGARRVEIKRWSRARGGGRDDGLCVHDDASGPAATIDCMTTPAEPATRRLLNTAGCTYVRPREYS